MFSLAGIVHQHMTGRPGQIRNYLAREKAEQIVP